MHVFNLNTQKQGFIDITEQAAHFVSQSKVNSGICLVYTPHTTAGITINENADPDVVSDVLMAIDKIVPDLQYKHIEGNSAAHVKSSIIGCSVSIPVINGKLCLGTWQGIYFCEFDGPRTRKFFIQIIGD